MRNLEVAVRSKYNSSGMVKARDEYLEALGKLLGEAAQRYLYPCIEDLVVHGLGLERFSPGETKPNRQDATRYLAAWFRHMGISADGCREWMIEYCVDRLSVVSSSSRSQIRHSTKSNIKYIFRSEVSFDCRQEGNALKLACKRTCPLYHETAKNTLGPPEKRDVREYEVRPAGKTKPEENTRYHSKKAKYKEQFERAMEIARDQFEQGVTLRKIADHLNDRQFKTRTGRKWTYDILNRELKK